MIAAGYDMSLSHALDGANTAKWSERAEVQGDDEHMEVTEWEGTGSIQSWILIF